MANCEIHKVHSPKAQTQEDHHIIPQAWQAFWSPSLPRPSLIYTAANVTQSTAAGTILYRGLWDPRVATLCPTGHRNVHFYLVTMMRAGTTDDPTKVKNLGRGKEGAMAYLALERFAAAGGSLSALRAAHQWGQA